jgi:hypothetical protein
MAATTAVGGAAALLARPSPALAAGRTLGSVAVEDGGAAGRSRSLEVPGARLHYEVRGRGPLLVLVPGRKGNADSFRSLAAARFGTSIVDLPGGHIGMVTHPVEFAGELLDALDR